MITAKIISIGDELLIGQVVNTNAAWLAEQLNLIGIKVVEILTVQDNSVAINNAIELAVQEHQIVITTGGLGPTKDDITKQTLANLFNSKLVLNEAVLAKNKTTFKSRNLEFTEVNKKQAEVPECCEVIENTCGTAPGMWFNTNKGVLISLAGVSYEMQKMMELSILPRLKKMYQEQVIIHSNIMTCGLGESFLADRIAVWEDALPANFKLAYLPQPGILRLRLTAISTNHKELSHEVEAQVTELSKIIPVISTNHKELRHEVEAQVAALSKIIPDLIYSYKDEKLEAVIFRIFKENNYSLATAESCTGGLIAHKITSIAGSSAIFKGSVIAYSNEVKQNVLGVSPKTLEKFGAVSEECVKEMAAGVKKILNTDYAIATSGIAGPSGGTAEKPVGSVWIAVATPSKIIAEKFLFGDNRERNILRASVSALNLLRKNI